MTAPFADWRVLESSNGIAASYCGKMFADAGADVVKLESPQGDSMRRWSAGGAPGALFDYLAAGKRSVVRREEGQIAALLAGADIVVTDLTDGWTLEDITAHTGPAAVVVAVTPFGATGALLLRRPGLRDPRPVRGHRQHHATVRRDRLRHGQGSGQTGAAVEGADPPPRAAGVGAALR